ncbi:hypothetical protein PVAND_005509 [Polypedilum vanderplanki]|uniref:Uncharacterized protein n=1 Tax=Polypedilum vanderplanki TaxID=319348 RepID=A0A9J6C0E2_POLVA|nr:hypothetical protein PVAND_005509 [Polypedilum vanderplanki]
MFNTSYLNNIRTPLPEDDIVLVNRSLFQLSEISQSFINIFNMELTFKNQSEMEYYLQRNEEQKFRGHYACLSHLTFFPKVSIPNIVQVACQPTKASRVLDWHVVVVSRIGNMGLIFEPNFVESFPHRINQMSYKTKIRAVLEKLGLKPGMRINTRLFVGGGGNYYAQCRSLCFKFIKSFVQRYSQLDDPNQINQQLFFGNYPYKEVTW